MCVCVCVCVCVTEYSSRNMRPYMICWSVDGATSISFSC